MFLVRRNPFGWVILAIVFLSVTLVDTPVKAASTRQPNKITFNPLTSLLLSTQTYPLPGNSTSGLPLHFESLTPDTCAVSGATLSLITPGICTVRASQKGSKLFRPAKPIQVSITISDTHVTSDQVDAVTGFQVKPIYVVPADGVDHSYDINGFISGILDEGNRYLREELGLQIPLDRHSVGYDIQYLKSNLTTAQIQATDGQADELLAESLALENPGPNRKSYMFFIDVDSLKGGAACGWGYIPGMSAVVAVGPKCAIKSLNFQNYASSIWVHELFHNFGVSHTPDDPCDLMRGFPENTGTCAAGGKLTIDTERTRYINSSTQGQDIVQLRVWDGYTDRLDLVANCSLNPVSRSDGFKYAYCPTGMQTIGVFKYCWSSIRTTVLQEFVKGKWKRVGPGSFSPEPWGTKVSWKCTNATYAAASKQVTVTTPGTRLYRWMVNGKATEQLKVIWVR